MKYLLITSLIITSMGAKTVFDFNKKADVRAWRIVDDGVMGGKSQGNFNLNADGHGVFEGTVSLENYGGFSSVRCRMNPLTVKENSKIILKVKGDGKDYQFRIKDDSRSYFSYITTFSTNGKWEEIEISLKDMYPSFRGRKLDMPNFESKQFEEITFLVGNKKAEDFKLIIDKIELK